MDITLTEEDIADICVLCKSKQDSALNLREQFFLVNTAAGCGHRFCSTCTQREFHTKRQFACPRCKVIVTQSKLSAKSLEEIEAERDSAVRRKLKALFNKTEADFLSLDDLRDYEEMVEDLIYNLVHSINVEETKAAIEKYKQENTRLIAINQMKINQKFEEEQTIIQQVEERTRAQEREFMEKIADEQKMKKEKKKLQNQMLLGEGAPQTSQLGGDSSKNASSSQPVTNGSAQAAPVPSTLQAFLNQRPLPERLVDGERKRAAIRSSEDSRKLHRAGGYDYSCYEARNWAQIRCELEFLLS
eukprot:gene8736-9629_t